MLERLSLAVSLVLALAFLFPAHASAQGERAAITGTVTDPDGAPIPGVVVTAINQETGFTQTAFTSGRGTYRIPALLPGQYRITLEISGFATIERLGVVLEVGQTATLDFQMQLATVAETVTVTAQTPLVETTKSDIGGRVDQRQIKDLPLNGRNWQELSLLVPGVNGDGGTPTTGANLDSEKVLISIDSTDASNQCCGGSNTEFSQDSIEQFQVLTNRFDAQFGRSGGTVINAVTKSGSNSFAGSLFWFFRDDALNAADHFTGETEPFRRTDWGGNLGGPLVTDRAHFFGNYERVSEPSTATPNTGIPQLDVTVPTDFTRNLFGARVDTQLSDDHRLFVRAAGSFDESLNGGVGGRAAPSHGSSFTDDGYDIPVGHTWVLNDRAVSDLRVAYHYRHFDVAPNESVPERVFPSALLGSQANLPQEGFENNWEVAENFSIYVPDMRGDHNFKMGLNWYRVDLTGFFARAANGRFFYNEDPPDFFDPSTYPAPTLFIQGLGTFDFNVPNNIVAAYFQDDWTITDRLTVNLGLRYDIEFGSVDTDLITTLEEAKATVNDNNNFAPRVGFAYDVTGNGNFVVRGGFGMYYDQAELNLALDEILFNGTSFITVRIPNPDPDDPLGGKTFEDFQAEATPSDVRPIAPDFVVGYTHQESLGFQWEFTQDWAIQADYVHVIGTNWEREADLNLFFCDIPAGITGPDAHFNPNTQLFGGPCPIATFGRPDPRFAAVRWFLSNGRSLYDGLQMGVTKRYSNNFQLSATYTLGRGRDSTGSPFERPNNPFHWEDEYSFSQADQRHRVVLSGIADLPWDFRVSGIFFAFGGRRFDIDSPIDSFGDGFSGGNRLLADGTLLTRNAGLSDTAYKLDLRATKVVPLYRETEAEVFIEFFNLFNRQNNDPDAFGGVFGTSRYLQPGRSGNEFYQPFQAQIGFRINM